MVRVIGSRRNDFIHVMGDGLLPPGGYRDNAGATTGADSIGIGAGAGADIVHGGAGGDRIFGEAGNDSLFGGDGRDRLDGGAGADRLAGGAGSDIYVVDHLRDRVVETGGAERDLVRASVNFTLSALVEDLRLTGLSGLTGTGNALANRLTGGSGNDRLIGREGADRLNGGAGDDRLLAGAGNDRLLGGGATTACKGPPALIACLAAAGTTPWQPMFCPPCSAARGMTACQRTTCH